jgi:hypothetical protein
MPSAGEACGEYFAGLTCEYEFCYAMTPMVVCGEVSGQWEVLPQPPCNPPPPECFFDNSCAPGSGDAGASPSIDAGTADGGR